MTVCASNDNAHPPSVSQHKKRGFTLTEIAIVLGIIGLILGAIWVAAAAVYNNLRVSKATTELLTIAQGARALYATSSTTGDAAGVDETNVWIKGGIFPADTINGATANGPWNSSTITADSETINASTPGDGFGIQFSGVPQSACIALLVGNTGSGRDNGLWNATASAAAVAAGTAYGTATATAFPITPTTALASCKSATSNAVQFVFKLKG
jgi:prepilin-type N-terminal cleavage/methylation domain-containing protein